VRICEETTALFSSRACEKQVKLACWSKLGPSVIVQADEVRIRQILTNLVGNALKFTESGVVEIGIRTKGNGIVLLVRDTGIGIAEHRQKAIFESFTQADGSTTRKYGGTGLGLAIVKRLVDLMDGEVSLTSAVGHGSTFEVFIPIQPTSTATPEQPSLRTQTFELKVMGQIRESVAQLVIESQGGEIIARNADWVLTDDPTMQGPNVLLWKPHGSEVISTRQREIVGPLTPSSLLKATGSLLIGPKLIRESKLHHLSGKILLVEDNPVNQRVATHLLRGAGLDVDVADNGRVAVELVQSQSYDIVLMDVQMPEMDGLTATRAIREWEATSGKRVPIWAMTAHAMAGDREKCLEAGMDGYITKPINKRKLMEEITPFVRQDVGPIVLDRKYLEDISGGDTEFEVELLATFAESAPDVFANLQEAIEASDSDQIMRTSHTLKGSSRSIGGLAFAEVCETIERAARQDNVEVCLDLRPMLKERYEALIEICRAA
jgi:CheY-like chemotaxis protein/anti-sigma regulatory factor (Ser/Thr protein kinase)